MLLSTPLGKVYISVFNPVYNSTSMPLMAAFVPKDNTIHFSDMNLSNWTNWVLIFREESCIVCTNT